MSGATVVVEAGWRSGSLNTAHHALELDRPLGVVPGPVTSASSAGCHRLLRETPAICVTTATEIAELTGLVSRQSENSSEPEIVHPFAPRVLDALHSRKGHQAGEIAKASGLSEPETLAVLGLLELSGAVREVATGWVRVSA
jgi:DNA processing protein